MLALSSPHLRQDRNQSLCGALEDHRCWGHALLFFPIIRKQPVMHLFHIPKPCLPLLSQSSGVCGIPQLSVWEQKPLAWGSPLKCQVVGVTLSWRKGLSVVPFPNLPEEYMPQDCVHPLSNSGHPDYSNSFNIHCEVRKTVTIQRYSRKARDIGHGCTLCPATVNGHDQSLLNCASFRERPMWWAWNCSLHHFSPGWSPFCACLRYWKSLTGLQSSHKGVLLLKSCQVWVSEKVWGLVLLTSASYCCHSLCWSLYNENVFMYACVLNF